MNYLILKQIIPTNNDRQQMFQPYKPQCQTTSMKNINPKLFTNHKGHNWNCNL